MTQEDKEYLKDLIYSQKEVFRNGTDEEVDKISDEIMEKIIDVSFKYAKAEQDEIFEYCYEIMYQIDKELVNEIQWNFRILWFLNETILARVFQHVEENCCVCISAERNEITDPKERKEREKSLEIDIKKVTLDFQK